MMVIMPPRGIEAYSEGIMGKRLLVLDDDEFVRRLVAGVLSRYLGLEVFQAKNGGEAIATALTGLYDGAIIDLVMRQSSGCRVIRTIRTMLPVFPMIGMAAQATDNVARTARQLGVTTILYKPFKMSALIEGVTELLSIPSGLTSQV